MEGQTYYERMVTEKRGWYKAVRQVHCPLLSEDIHFTSKGFRHLLYDGLGHARSKKERMYRLGLLPLLIPVIKNANEVIEYKSEFSKKLGKKTEIWELGHVVGKQNTKVTVILRRIGTGNIHFYSIWKKKDKRRN
ncbi:MAG: hypothetical protein HYS45_02275 [Parcubacteria group bacterium]|nr:hypothetical protein [Parcubacteria group bacterium]